MSVFKENLTSQLIKENAVKIINKKKIPLKILELGCGNGNISKYLLQNQNRDKKNEYFASDISKEAISMAKKNPLFAAFSDGWTLRIIGKFYGGHDFYPLLVVYGGIILGTLCFRIAIRSTFKNQWWCPNTDLNRKPTDYKSVALPIELLGHLVKRWF